MWYLRQAFNSVDDPLCMLWYGFHFFGLFWWDSDQNVAWCSVWRHSKHSFSQFPPGSCLLELIKVADKMSMSWWAVRRALLGHCTILSDVIKLTASLWARLYECVCVWECMPAVHQKRWKRWKVKRISSEITPARNLHSCITIYPSETFNFWLKKEALLHLVCTFISWLSCFTMCVMVSTWFSSSFWETASTCEEPWMDLRSSASSSPILKACSSSTASFVSGQLRWPSVTSRLNQDVKHKSAILIHDK